VAARYARSQVQKAQEVRRGSTEVVSDRRASDESQQPIQAADNGGSSRRRRASASRDSEPVVLRRHFVRKAMGIEIELDITMEELADIWRNRESFGIMAFNQKDEPQEEDVEVDGQNDDTDWDESATDWMDAKKAAVRKMVACLMNDAASLPGIGRRVDRIVRRVGTVDIYFDDGSFVSASVEDPQPRTNEEAAVIESVYGQPAPAKSCGCKKANCIHTAAPPTVDMIAAVRANRELLGARDERKVGVKTPRWWTYQTDPPFDLWLLRDVPMSLARELTDFPLRAPRLRNPRQGWTIAREFADGSPFQRRR